MAVDCPTIRDLLCVTRVMGVPFEYVANGRTKSGKRIKRIIKSSTRGLFEVVDRVPNWPQRFIPEVGTALSAFLTNMTKFGMPVAGILTMGSYFCRCIKHTKKLSNHSFGDAIDIVGVRWPAATGSSSWLSDTIIHNFNTGDEREMRLVRRINACLRLSFATVLDYNYKPRPHLDHFHCDLRNSRRRDRRPRRPDTLYFVQEALTLMRGRPVPTTGKWDPLTERGLMEFSGASQESLRKEDSLLNRILDDLFTRVAAQT
jgi:hypothetical protein